MVTVCGTIFIVVYVAPGIKVMVATETQSGTNPVTVGATNHYGVKVLTCSASLHYLVMHNFIFLS